MYAIVDLESTGGKYNEEGITEIAIYKFDGQNIVDQFSCLVNPERKIQPFVVKLTGINNDMLRYAPKFFEVAKRVIEITEDCVIVAHNAKFDYRLLRTEFKRLGYDYQRKTLCTVELSKKLIPGMPSYSLGKLVKNLGIPLTDRHRAIGDAQATVKLFKLLLNKDTDKKIVSSQLKQRPQTPVKKAFLKILDSLPTDMGVYYLHNQEGDIIYLGAHKNIRKRVSQLLTGNSPKVQKIQQEIASASYDLTGNELVARLKENEILKKIKPKYNTAAQKPTTLFALYHFTDHDGYVHLKLGKTRTAKCNIITFTQLSHGKKFLEEAVANFNLNPVLSGLQKGKNALKESPEVYNQRVKKFIDEYSLRHKNKLLIGPGRTPEEKSALLIEKGTFKGMAYFDLNFQIRSPEIIRNLLTPMKDTPEARHIIQHYLRKKNNRFKTITF